MYDLKQSTALTVPVFVHDVNGDAVTGLTDGSFTKRISKNGGAFAAMTVTLTEMENGWYSLPLSTSHTDTLGLLTVTLTNGGAKQVNLQWRVAVRLTDDVATQASVDVVDDFLDTEIAAILADTNDIQARLPAALVSGRMDSSVGAMAADVVTAAAIANGAIDAATFASGAIDNAAIAADAIGSSELAASAVTEIQSGLATSAAVATLQTSVDTVDDFVDTEVAAILAAVDTEVGAIKTKTDQLTFTVANSVDATVGSLGANAITAASLAADGALPTVRQALYMIVQFLLERIVSGTTVTVKKVDGTTTLMTLTLDSATTPTSITRTT